MPLQLGMMVLQFGQLDARRAMDLPSIVTVHVDPALSPARISCRATARRACAWVTDSARSPQFRAPPKSEYRDNVTLQKLRSIENTSPALKIQRHRVTHRGAQSGSERVATARFLCCSPRHRNRVVATDAGGRPCAHDTKIVSWVPILLAWEFSRQER